jgi:ADP-ribose pyrophosphatase YjhB (NUDIX family)
MKRERFKIGPYVALILRKNDTILLIRRYKTENWNGFYACAGGGVDGNEPITQAMIREAREELGITLHKENLRVVHVLHTKERDGDTETVGFFLEATVWSGEPQNMEPHKHDDLAWFPVHKLPQNTMPALKHVMAQVQQNIFYSEFGWD